MLATGNNLPDVIGLCEIGSEKAAIDLADELHKGSYRVVSSDVPSPKKPLEPQTGLAMLYRDARLTRTTATEAKDSTQQPGSRCKWMAVEFQVGSRLTDVIWIVVNHWTFAHDKKKQCDWRTFDHVLLTRRLLTGGPLQLEESSLRVQPASGHCSDHHAISISLT
jgi:hypothetical protein